MLQLGPDLLYVLEMAHMSQQAEQVVQEHQLRIHQSSAVSRRLFDFRVELVHDRIAGVNIINVVAILDGQVSKTSDPS